MKNDRSRFIWGGILILAGTLFMLQELNILGNAFQSSGQSPQGWEGFEGFNQPCAWINQANR